MLFSGITLNPFRMPSARQLAQRELEDARREWLRAATQVEYAMSIRQYNAQRIQRLEEMLQVSPVGVPVAKASEQEGKSSGARIGFLANIYKEKTPTTA